MKRFFVAGLILLLTLALALELRGYQSGEGAEPDPSPSPSLSVEPAPVLAFFGASNQPWCEELREQTADWCRETGWELVEYDCLGLETTQDVQVDDLLRAGKAELAVLCALGAQESLDAKATALAEGGVAVITLSGSPLEPPEDALCHLGPDSDSFWGAAARFFRSEDGAPRLILLRDSSGSELENAARDGLEGVEATVLEEVFTWGSADYAQQFLTEALDRQNRVDGVVCFSRTGAQGARAALGGTGRRGEIPVLCMTASQTLWDDLERGVLDGLATLDARAGAEALEQALTQACQGKVPVGGTLPVAVQTK